eukprot:TRINITY_DN19575_c0_g1_i1.p2 TRINITY_DN19575_c0_g1~~TRINITY_DN19575_c0_g1_i1.p2  ORF type:complete len:111 (+),score=23.62 TRINITY_DN19575_c0_g1_i1:129-461(+)
MLRSLVGSEMCIRDRHEATRPGWFSGTVDGPRECCVAGVVGGSGAVGAVLRGRLGRERSLGAPNPTEHLPDCLLYTSDAADEEDSVDLGGRRIIKKKTNNKIIGRGGDTR